MTSAETGEPELLKRVEFPLYSVSVLGSRHLIVGGGGGAANTGVKNGFEVLELGHDGTRTTAESVSRHETIGYAVMNMAAGKYDKDDRSSMIAVGHDESCQVYQVRMVRKNKTKGPADPGGNHSGPSPLGFEFSPVTKTQTDYNIPEPYQKCVRLSPSSNKLLATGGDDGFLRLWTFPELTRTHEIEAHEKEIDDLDFSPDGARIVTISKDRRAFVWDVAKGRKHAEMGWNAPKGVKYLFKRIRFAKVEGDIKRQKVFTISNPIGASKPPAFLQRWNTKTFTLEQAITKEGSLSAIAVSDNGNFVAIGTMFDGTIEIYTAFNLQCLKRVEKSHATFITGLEFLPTSEEADVIRGYSDASVVSISVDHQICVHHVPRLRQISMVAATFILAALLIITFIFCSFLGL